MKIKKSGKNISPEKQAVINAAKENGHNIKINRDIHLSGRNYYHKFYDFRLQRKNEISTQGLVKLANEFIQWIEESNKPVLFQTFWLKRGIRMQILKDFCEHEPEFADIVEAGRQLIGEKWGGVLLGEIESTADRYILRQRAPVYIQEWRQHDKEMNLEHEQAKAEYIEQQKKEETSKSTFIVNMVDYGKEESKE